MTANKHQGIRAALCWNKELAMLSKTHNNANVICIPARFIEKEDALEIVKKIYDTAGKGHSCGIYSHDDNNIDALARVAPVSRMMVRQAQSKSNAGSYTNGMPMTSSLGCGIWGGNITNENVTMKHMMNYTWVSRPISEDKPSEQDLFGEFYGNEVA